MITDPYRTARYEPSSPVYDTSEESEQRQPDGWISTGDQLPENSDYVLVCIDFDAPWLARAVCIGWYEDGCWRMKAAGRLDRNSAVTHWMPLPEAPSQTEEG